MSRVLRLESITHDQRQLAICVSLGGMRISTSYWYEGIDLHALDHRYGRELMDWVYVHIAAFELLKVVSLRPETLELGPWARFHTVELERLWRRVFEKVWAQWRYENDLPDYRGPAFASSPVPAPVEPVELTEGPTRALMFCGGGKDSLLAMRLLAHAGVEHASLAYSHSIYGRAAPQHRLIDGLLDQGTATARHRMWMYDDFMDSPVIELAPQLGVRSIAAAETPVSLFAALPIVLAHGYSWMVLGHEHSANVGNLVWDRTGEDINHQWGKSHEAERLLDGYLSSALIGNARYFSILQPVYDMLIFNLLAEDLEGIAQTHSCNVAKPWCRRCPKCAYVWLNYMAYFPREFVDSMFGENLFELEDNQRSFHQMLGLGEHTPFECIGQIDEARIAFELCRRKGLSGRAMDVYRAEVGSIDVERILAKHLAVESSYCTAPEPLGSRVLERMTTAATRARAELRARLK